MTKLQVNSPNSEIQLHCDNLYPPVFSNIPNHIAIIMDGNGRWATQRGLPRIEGHKIGEQVLMDIVAGAIEAQIKELSLYTFSTENWQRNPAEVKFLMGFSRDIIHQRTALLDKWGVKIQWCGRKPKLWKSVYSELKKAEKQTEHNRGLVLNMCINYGGQNEIIDAVNLILAQRIQPGLVNPKNQRTEPDSYENDAEIDDYREAKSVGDTTSNFNSINNFGKINLKSFRKFLYQPKMREVDLLIRTGGQMRISNFLLFQIAYAELYFDQKMWPDYNRQDLWNAISEFGQHHRTYGK
ncbi:MAG: di-trans,poly-cis-decaprenylcistransferase [Bifidobacteriaceae bacterium]|jgi:undecaprenyl diphosphate synthase|nr:di-trans,poly-cis-decaprenylcistransferase [Bifidobacteriaceae bacterium]